MLIWIAIFIVTLVIEVPAWVRILAATVCIANLLWAGLIVYLTWKDKKEIENV